MLEGLGFGLFGPFGSAKKCSSKGGSSNRAFGANPKFLGFLASAVLRTAVQPLPRTSLRLNP